MGIQEHLWQATLGPDAVVFTTHPGNSQEHENARPNFWAGSARLPRVTMADDAVICLYDRSLGGGLPFTHAYFPAEAFDEYTLDGPWAFARVRNGYVALWADGDLRLTPAGRHAAQELRSGGSGAGVGLPGGTRRRRRRLRAVLPFDACACSADHGRACVLACPAWEYARGAWTGPLLVDGQPFDPTAFPHYDNLYTHTPMDADAMDLDSPVERIHLDLDKGRARSDR